MSNADLLVEELPAMCDGKPPELCVVVFFQGLQRPWERDHTRVAPEFAAANRSVEEHHYSSMFLGAVSKKAHGNERETRQLFGVLSYHQPNLLTTSAQKAK